MTATVVRCAGGPRERGIAVGRAFAGMIASSLQFYRGFLGRRGMGPDDLPRILAPYRDAAASAYPELLAELDGMAEGADASWWELFAANSWEEIETMLSPAPSDRCTSFAVSGPQGTILGHNELWYAGDGGNVGVVVADPDEGPAFASPTVVACLPSVGMSSAGLAVGVDSVSASDDGVGLPRVLVSRSALQAIGPDDLVRRVTLPGRSGGYAFVVAARGGRTFTVETSATGHALLEGAAHTNHYLDPRLAERGDPSASGEIRLRRLKEILAERRPSTPEEVMDVLKDHDSTPSICLHADETRGDLAEASMFAMVCHLEEGRMWVSAGNPCHNPYEEIDVFLREAV